MPALQPDFALRPAKPQKAQVNDYGPRKQQHDDWPENIRLLPGAQFGEGPGTPIEGPHHPPRDQQLSNPG